MALLKNGLTWTVWALSGLVAFFFGLVGAAPPAWAESGVRMAQAERSSASPPRPSAPQRVERPPEHMMGEVIPKLEIPPTASEAKGYMKIEDIKGESQGKVFPKVESETR